MSNYKGKINLMKLPGAVFVKGRSGQRDVRGMFLPIDGNYAVYEGAKGLYVRFTVKEYQDGPEGHFGNSHNIRISVDREVYDQMSADQRAALPFIGEMSPMKLEGYRHDAPVLEIKADDDGDLDF